MRLFDTHAHLDDKSYHKDRAAMIDRAKAAGVARIVNVGYDLDSSRRSIQLAEEYDFIFAAVGIHPHDAKAATPEAYDCLREMSGHPKVVAIGEMGLDYYRDLSPRNIQSEVFIAQLEMARELNKPIIIHDRDAHGDIMKILETEAKDLTGVLHCYSGSWEMAKVCLKLGFYLSFAGPVTYQNARGLVDVAKNVPLEQMFIETDAPYLTPHPYRGTRNESAHVSLIAEKIASIKNISVEEAAEQTYKNGCTLFRIPL